MPIDSKSYIYIKNESYKVPTKIYDLTYISKKFVCDNLVRRHYINNHKKYNIDRLKNTRENNKKDMSLNVGHVFTKLLTYIMSAEYSTAPIVISKMAKILNISTDFCNKCIKSLLKLGVISVVQLYKNTVRQYRRSDNIHGVQGHGTNYAFNPYYGRFIRLNRSVLVNSFMCNITRYNREYKSVLKTVKKTLESVSVSETTNYENTTKISVDTDIFIKTSKDLLGVKFEGTSLSNLKITKSASKKNRQKALLEYKKLCRIQNRDYYLLSKYGRNYTPVHSLSNKMMCCLTHDSKNISQIYDVRSCFSTLISYLLIGDINLSKRKDVIKYADICKNGDIYYTIAELANDMFGTTYTRSDMKIPSMFYNFSTNIQLKTCLHKDDKKSIMNRHFMQVMKSYFPSVHYFRNKQEIQYNNKKKCYVSKLSIYCQILESRIMFGHVVPFLKETYPTEWFITKHDAVYANTDSKIDATLINDTFHKYATVEAVKISLEMSNDYKYRFETNKVMNKELNTTVIEYYKTNINQYSYITPNMRRLAIR